MLVLTRKVGEEIVIGTNIRITVVAIQGGKVRIGITAPKEIVVDRQEVRDNRKSFLDAEPLRTTAPIGQSSIKGDPLTALKNCAFPLLPLALRLD